MVHYMFAFSVGQTPTGDLPESMNSKCGYVSRTAVMDPQTEATESKFLKA